MVEAGGVSRQPSLFRQIAVRLGILTAIFALLDVAIVVPMYAFDQQALAEDFIEQQAERIDHRLGDPSGLGWAASAAARLEPPPGVESWGFEVIAADREPALRVGALAPLPRPGARALDFTQRDATPSGTLVTGLRRFSGQHGPYWIFVSAHVVGTRAYWPVIGQELLAHVALPLAPLLILLLVFNAQVVRRMLAPLERAALEVDALDPARMDARLSPPTTSREVAALVSAVNRALDRLQKAMALLKTFTADAAHELRTPLSVLRLRTDALPDSATKVRLGEEIQTMIRLVNQMLDLAQADVLRLDGAEPVDLQAMAAEVVAQIAPHAFAAGHDIQLTDLGSTPALGHRDALGRALRNLVENAIHHTQGGRPIEVSVGPGARFSVRDFGPGLPAEGEKIFDRFWRQSRAQDGGAGLGLGIVRSIVEAHGGAVEADNTADAGAVFTCVFPAAPPLPTFNRADTIPADGYP
ncbi:MAG: HAMP domain-containing histidine kinase [Phenylobacterium sp.]|nr:HAMP domain-containing histidine kinase [Phenylobacterium sp.]MBP7816177.1 HAMP domain-containing histidine kinase [Phenylobacterium sp.]MBP9756776.1 HAMP domain-containing histidine kinase [Phenylobacterium sp.]